MVMCIGMRARTWRDVIQYNGSLSNMMGHYYTALGKDRSIGLLAFIYWFVSLGILLYIYWSVSCVL